LVEKCTKVLLEQSVKHLQEATFWEGSFDVGSSRVAATNSVVNFVFDSNFKVLACHVGHRDLQGIAVKSIYGYTKPWVVANTGVTVFFKHDPNYLCSSLGSMLDVFERKILKINLVGDN